MNNIINIFYNIILDNNNIMSSIHNSILINLNF